MSNLKLGVEVKSAHGLIAKDGQGSASPYVELHFDHQKFTTTVKEKDLDPYWNETFYFNISDPNNLPNLTLDAYVYNRSKGINLKNFMGKVHINGTSFVRYSDAVDFHYPLEKKTVFSRVKGELGLKVFVTDNPSIMASNPPPQMDTSSHNRNGSKDSRKTFYHLPNSNSVPPTQVPSQQPYMAAMTQRQQPYAYGVEEMRNVSQSQVGQFQGQPKVVRMYSGSSSQPMEYALKETSPFLGGGQVIGGRVVTRDSRRASTYDLVEAMQFLFVRVVKAQELPSKDMTGSLDPFVEVRVGNYKGITQHFSKTSSPEWNTVFAFSRERMQATVLDVVVKDKDMIKDDFVGLVRVNLHDIPTRVPPDSPLAPEWYRLEDKKGEKKKGELMLAVWMGTQADEAFPDAFLVDQATSSVDSAVSSMYTRSKVYHSPSLWYVRVNVIEVQDLVWGEKTRFPDVYVKVQIHNQVLKTRHVQARNANALWNQDMILVAAEPLEDHLILSIEDLVGPNKEETLGKVVIPLNSVERRADDRIIHSRWFHLQDPSDNDVDEKIKKKDKFATRLHVRVCLDGGYHVLDESTQYSSDLRPTAKQLWKPSIGILELGILNASALHPMKTRDGRGTTDAYCVAKYGHKWVRTRTVIDSLTPKFNEQYTWEVYDPSTVITVGVFDNSQLKNDSNSKDVRIGKIRIRISTLETGRVYTHSYPLLVLHPSGVKKMGELHLAIRFSSTSMVNMMYMYSKPLLPKMHYVRPLTVVQLEMLRHQAVGLVAARLSRAEPPLRKEIVEFMTDANSHLWSMRKSKANFFRLMAVFNGVFSAYKWFGEVCLWKNPITSVLVHVLFVMLVSFPELIMPTVFLYMFLIGLWNYWFRAQYPPHMNTRLSYADGVSPDELDEEFDTFPTTRHPDVVRHRYDRLRSVAGRIQSVVGDIASQGERLQGLLSWRDPRATLLFMVFCVVAAFVLYATPFKVLVVLSGFYVMRHPRFRHRLPSAPLNFFRRLPARTDSML